MKKSFPTALIIAVAILGAAFLVSNAKFSVKSLDTQTTQNGQLVNSISVSGQGKVFANPDILQVNVGISKTRSTSREALNEVNQQVAKIKEILKESGIEEKDIQTTNLSIYPEYDWKGERGRVLKGQRASQSLTFKVKGIDKDINQATTIIDQLSAINEVQVNSLSFDVEDKTEHYSQARELAFKKAKQKAGELADLGDLDLLKPVSITDQSVDHFYAPARQNFAMEQKAAMGMDGAPTDISAGQMEININLQVVFGVE